MALSDQPSSSADSRLSAASRAVVALAEGSAGWLWVTSWEGWGMLLYEYREPETLPLLLPMEASFLSLLLLGDSHSATGRWRDVALCATFAQTLALMEHARPIKPEVRFVEGDYDSWEYCNPQARLPCWMDRIDVLYRCISQRRTCSKFPKSFAYIGLVPPVGTIAWADCQQLAAAGLLYREFDIFVIVRRLAPDNVLEGSMPPEAGADMMALAGGLIMFSAACASQLFTRVLPHYSFAFFISTDHGRPAAAAEGSVGVAIPDVSALEYVFRSYEAHDTGALRAATEKLRHELKYVATFPKSLAFALDRIRIDDAEITELVQLCATKRRKYPKASLAVLQEHPRTANIASSVQLHIA